MTYTGETNSKGEPHAHGTLTYLSSNYHGQGTWTYPDGTKYTGKWKDGKPVAKKARLYWPSVLDDPVT